MLNPEGCSNMAAFTKTVFTPLYAEERAFESSHHISDCLKQMHMQQLHGRMQKKERFVKGRLKRFVRTGSAVDYIVC